MEIEGSLIVLVADNNLATVPLPTVTVSLSTPVKFSPISKKFSSKKSASKNCVVGDHLHFFWFSKSFYIF